MNSDLIWNKQIGVIKASLLKWAIDNEIESRSAPEQNQVYYKISGETLRQCLILIEDSLAEVPGYVP